MNAIEAFRNQQLGNLHGTKSPRRSRDLSLNSIETTPSIEDIRQRSLQTYKSINNLIALVGKTDHPPREVIPLSEIRAVSLDFVYNELCKIGFVNAELTQTLRSLTLDMIKNKLDHMVLESNKQQIHLGKLQELLTREIITKFHIKENRRRNPTLKYEVSYASNKGNRKTMEDETVCIDFMNELIGEKNVLPPTAFFGIYDGHSGNQAAEYSRIHLHMNIFEGNESDMKTAIVKGYKKTDKDFKEYASKNEIPSGASAVTMILRSDLIYIANVGDSEAVLCQNGKPIVLSRFHLPNDESEKERIQDAGGKVVWYGTWRVNGLLSVSRAIGDYPLDKFVIPDPHIYEHVRTPEDQFIILASDGLWEVFKYQEACDFILDQLKTKDKRDVAQLLVNEAIAKKTSDNLSALIVFFE